MGADALLWQGGVPSKTFLLGEYVALGSGPALMLTTQPAFSMRVFSDEHPLSHQPDAYADLEAVWRAKQPDLPVGLRFVLDSPYAHGGFGASSAWWLLAERFLAFRRGDDAGPSRFLSDRSFRMAWLQRYQACMQVSGGVKPSGYDALAQAVDVDLLAVRGPERIDSVLWPFPEVDVLLCYTGHALTTHEHLASVDVRGVLAGAVWVEAGFSALASGDLEGFCTAIEGCQRWLTDSGWVVSSTQRLVATVSDHADVLACKGCGAGGADVLAVLVLSQHRASVSSWLEAQGVLPVSCFEGAAHVNC
jgi:mevalonate kinase